MPPVAAAVARTVVAIASLAALLCCAPNARASDSAAWHMVAGTMNLHQGQDTGARLWLDMHARREPGRFVGIFRPAIGWDLGDGLSVWAGYSFVPVVPSAGASSVVHDLWQQAMWSRRLAGMPVLIRARVEEQWIKGNDAVSLRGRLFVRAAPAMHKRVALSIFDEVFYAFNATAKVATGVRENRVFVGPAFLADGWRAELGYMNIIRPGAAIEMQHTAAGALFFKL